MSEYHATIQWQRNDNEDFLGNKFSRAHNWTFDGGLTVPASASSKIVPLPYALDENIDPEEAFIAALSSCHMLFFIAYAAKKRFVVDDYTDHASGVLAENSEGKMAMTQVTLRPKVVFSGEHLPSREDIEKIHHMSHEKCYIANSVTSDIIIDIQF